MSENTKQDKHYGMTKAEWLKLWEDVKWSELVLNTCREIVQCEHAAPPTRERAMQIWKQITDIGLAPVIPVDDRPMPEIIRDLQLSMVRGRAPGVVLNERLRDDMDERLGGVQLMLHTVLGFMELPALMAKAQMLDESEQRHSDVGQN